MGTGRGNQRLYYGKLIMNKRLNLYRKIADETTNKLKAEIRNYYRTKSRKNELETSIDNTPGKPLRSQSQLIRDKILTTKILLPDRGRDKRSKALTEVLCSIPYKDYENLKQTFKNDRVLIQVPRRGLGGCVQRVKRNIDVTLYLSPILETYKYPFVLNTTAHELSHLLLHSDFSKNKRRSSLERQADLQVATWGF